MVPFARCPTSELVNHALNAGAGGIVMPHIQTKKQAEALVRLAKFPPRGDRSVPPYALLGPGKETPAGKSTLDIWDEHVAIFCQIEDTVGVSNVEEIANVPGGTLNSPLRMFLTWLTHVWQSGWSHGRWL